MSHWSSERAILRDLSRAQGGAPDGRDAPRVRPLRASERPPRLCLHEETEEEYFQHCVGDSDALVKPDLKLIRQMLDMVRDLRVSEDEVKTTDVAVISKLNPTSPAFIPCNAKPAAETKAPKQTPAAVASPLENVPFTKSTTLVTINKRARQRNIALESFREMQSGERNDDAEHSIQPRRLLKPEDLISYSQENANEMSTRTSMQKGQVKRAKTDIPEKDAEHYETKVKNEAVEKVNEWMTQMTSPIKSKPAAVELDPRNMFKKKSKPEAETCQPFMNPLSMFKTKAVDKTKVMESKKPSFKGNSAYVPSTHAGEYYQKYLEKSQLMESLHDDIWTKAEKEMKEIDERKRQRAATAPAPSATRALSDLAGDRIPSDAEPRCLATAPAPAPGSRDEPPACTAPVGTRADCTESDERAETPSDLRIQSSALQRVETLLDLTTDADLFETASDLDV